MGWRGSGECRSPRQSSLHTLLAALNISMTHIIKGGRDELLCAFATFKLKKGRRAENIFAFLTDPLAML